MLKNGIQCDRYTCASEGQGNRPGGEYIMESIMIWYSSPIGMRWADRVAR